MSETIGNPVSRPGTDPSSATATAGNPAPAVHEAYSFACLSCGYGWEQDYAIEHHTDRDGRTVCQYRANGVRVPSPLLKPTCPGCGGHTVRIMRAGRVAAVGRSWTRNPGAPGPHPAGTEPERHEAGHHEPGHHEPEPRAAAPRRDEYAGRKRPRRRLHLPFHLHLRRRHGGPQD
ncbi:hypothetical protein LO771_16500 [Streptacidiphilus sp. ASG 303]|uniref:hypothetical protein n=1 Tax=Streptacidiphilus sp. ASG 303 TaxID=2896847 RepID=UPI001E3699BD|nr:hypothetical protein [Streptacidiphilus sp. ASG 303]MCD0483951.1 hypothetical protein [Streptacidiphilus sp. ASG 303]